MRNGETRSAMGVILWTPTIDLFLVISTILLGLQALLLGLENFGNGSIFIGAMFITDWVHKLKTFF